ncbi:hypothetical protein AT2G33685, partial [Arabidopsis thaliana]
MSIITMRQMNHIGEQYIWRR